MTIEERAFIEQTVSLSLSLSARKELVTTKIGQGGIRSQLSSNSPVCSETISRERERERESIVMRETRSADACREARFTRFE